MRAFLLLLVAAMSYCLCVSATDQAAERRLSSSLMMCLFCPCRGGDSASVLGSTAGHYMRASSSTAAGGNYRSLAVVGGELVMAGMNTGRRDFVLPGRLVPRLQKVHSPSRLVQQQEIRYQHERYSALPAATDLYAEHLEHGNGSLVSGAM